MLKKADQASLKSNVEELDRDKLKNVPSGSSNLKIKLDKLGVDKLVPVPVDLSKVSDVVKMLLKRLIVVNWLKTLMALRQITKL